MREGPEAPVGGPPLSLSVGLALSAFRPRPLGRDATPAPSEDVPSPLTWSTGIRVKAFLQQLSFLWCFFNDGPPAWAGGGEDRVGRVKVGG